MLWSLNAPVLIMLALYLFMVSRLIIGRQLNEIALLTSRGGSRIKIIFIYFIEVLLLGALAFMIGPALGALLVKVLGASNGFLEFVQRSALPVNIVPTAYIYAFLTVMASVVMIMLPVYFASGQSIVHHKQKLARTAGKQRWYMVILDLALLGAALYGLIAYNRQQTVTGSRPDLFIDPALFFYSGTLYYRFWSARIKSLSSHPNSHLQAGRKALVGFLVQHVTSSQPFG